ncbi:MmcQ/YjbR family DNA-binding protein [uncultured Corynebacterium sp.]|uniref:MmcQ/YjbR family DNA-binding protein n=1 Tax=uncultured Corynebacterium sp. TaxID=159447 RepID=UPI0025CC3570|nr:MmcQ/YjbR family DNA-binding protein [uncultured Corynebacterium sp.]
MKDDDFDGAEMLRHSKEVALELPVAEITHPFGPEWDVFKVAGKMFMLHHRLPEHGAKDIDAPGGTSIIVVKAEPGDAHALQQAHPFVFPGYHLNKKHWITVVAPGEVGGDGAGDAGSDAGDTGNEASDDSFADLVRELVVDSYRNVVLGLPKAKRPVDPMSFGSER